MTTVYLIRHSEPFLDINGKVNSKDSLQLINEKNPLSVAGEKFAEKIASNSEFEHLDEIWCSNYVRAMSTAKYFAQNNGLKVNIDYRLGERIQGIKSWDEITEDFFERQLVDENYKIGDGENQKEVRARMVEFFDELLKQNKNKRIAVVSHQASMKFYLQNWCEIEFRKDIKFQGETISEEHFPFLAIFKFEFDDELNLAKIERLKIE